MLLNKIKKGGGALKEKNFLEKLFIDTANIPTETLKYMMYQEMKKQQFLRKEEREKLISDTADEVMKRIKIEINDDILDEEIKKLEIRLKKLGG